MKEYSLGLVTDTEKRIALIHKNRPDWEKGLLNGIGGRIEVGETPIEAVAREFEEEAGVYIRTQYWKQTISMVSTFTDSIVYIFTAKTETLDILKTMTDEEVVIVPLDNLPDNIIPNLQWMIPLSLSSCDMPIFLISNDPFDGQRKDKTS